MKILITGGSGVFGRAMIDYLDTSGNHDVVSLDIAPLPNEAKAKVQEIRGDIRCRKTVSKAMSGVDMVIHAAAALPSYSDEDIYSIDVDGTRNLLEAASLEGASRFIHISSTAVYGIPIRLPSHEDDEVRSYDAYNTAKIKAEKVCEDFRRTGMIISILRPKPFLGPGRLGLFGILFEWAYEGHHFPVIGSGRVPYQFLHVQDLCIATQMAMTSSSANDTFNIAASSYTTVREDFQSVLDAAGHGKRIVPLPLRLATTALQILDWLRLSPVYRRLYLRLVSGSFVDTEKAKRMLGFSARYSNKDALVETYHWYVDNRAQLQTGTGVSHTSLWRQGALRIGKAFF